MAWTQERVKKLRELWTGGHSASRIAKELGGVTRNAVLGKIFRMGLTGRGDPIHSYRLPQRPKLPSPKPLPEPKPEPIALLDITLLELTQDTCRWPTTHSGGEWHFCGHQTEGGKSYCPFHDERSVNVPTRTMSDEEKYMRSLAAKRHGLNMTRRRA